MPRKKKEEIEETTAEAAVEETEAAEVKADSADASTETGEEAAEDSSVIETVADVVADAVETAAETAATFVDTVSKAVTGNGESKADLGRGNRAERVGVVASDKMDKTVTVRVDRLVKHPMYRKYVKRRKKFMAHDELGATIGDKVRIVETRPLSARKRWRVVEIIQKAEK